MLQGKIFFTTRRIIVFTVEFIAALIIESIAIKYFQPLLDMNKSEETMNLFELMLNNIGFVIAILLAGFLIWQLYKWHKEDEALKRKDFIKTIKEIQEAQRLYYKEAFRLYTVNLKRELNALKGKIEESEIDSNAFKHFSFHIEDHISHFKNPDENLSKWLNRLERHKSDTILEEIRADEVKNRIEQ